MLNATFGGKSMKIRALNRKLAKQDPEGTFDSPLDHRQFRRRDLADHVALRLKRIGQAGSLAPISIAATASLISRDQVGEQPPRIFPGTSLTSRLRS
jgi:hypothetical protein